jgi:hypothetical protein
MPLLLALRGGRTVRVRVLHADHQVVAGVVGQAVSVEDVHRQRGTELLHEDVDQVEHD